MSSSVTVEARATVRAPADRVYELIADYRAGHPRIVPPKYFQNLVVERGDELALLSRVATSDSSSAERHEHARGKYEVD